LEAVESVPKQLFDDRPVPTNDLRHLPTNDQAQLQQYDLKGDDNTSAYAGAAGCFHYIWGL